MSETPTNTSSRQVPASLHHGTGWSGGRLLKKLALLALLVFMLVLPLYIDEFWLRTGFAVFGSIIGAVGLNLLVGTTGQLSLGHAFSSWLSAPSPTPTSPARAAVRPTRTAACSGRRSWA